MNSFLNFPSIANRSVRFALIIIICAIVNVSWAEPVKIWISSQQDKIYYDNMVRLYQQEVDADFQAEVQAFGFREMPDKLAIAFKTQTNTPDIVQLDEVFFGMYLQGEAPFVDLTDRVKAVGLDESIMPQRLELFSLGDRVLGLPQSLSAVVIYYRRDLFQQFSLSPSEFKTWDDFMAIGEELAAQNQPLLALDPSYFGMLLRQRGGHLFSETGDVLPDFELAVETLEFMGELAQKRIGLMPDRSTIFDPVFFGGDVANNEILAIMGADWYGLDMIQQFSSELEGEWGIMPLPVWTDEQGNPNSVRTSTFAGQGLVVYKGSDLIDESWEFVKFVMTNREANAQRFLQGNSFPAYKPAFEDIRLLQPQPFFGYDSMGQILVDLAPEVPRVMMNPKRPMAVFMIREGMLSSVMYGEGDARTALTRFKDQLEGGGGPPPGVN